MMKLFQLRPPNPSLLCRLDLPQADYLGVLATF